MTAARGYFSLLRPPRDLVLAVRGTFQVQSASTPFEGMNLIPYIGSAPGAGGCARCAAFRARSFRGPDHAARQRRAAVDWFVRLVVWRQKLAPIRPVPFVDVGTVADRLSAVRRGGWRPDAGAALRISWNLATILTIDYGRSSEDAGLFVNFNHIF